MNTNGIYILSIERENPDNVGYFDSLDDTSKVRVDMDDSPSYAYKVVVNFYGKEDDYYIGIDNHYNFHLFNDILLKALNVVMVDTDRRELEQMFYNANQWYSYRTPKVYC